MSEVGVQHDIRVGVPGDAEACAAILNAWIDATPWMPRLHSARDVERFHRETVFVCRRVWVAGAPIRGFLALAPEVGMVMSLYVATPGQGLGKALLDQAKAGSNRLELWTFQANEGARRFYAREGFAEVRRTVGDNDEDLPDVLLRWEGARDG